MAAANPSPERQNFVCGICVENYTTPRYLPTCGHTFCENCLLTLASNLQQQGSKLECPVCRKPHRLPENEVTLKWIQTFPLNSVIIKMMESGSESLDQKRTVAETEGRRECDPCKERGETVTGIKFCMDCQEVYCKACTDSHKAFKMSRSHKLIDTKDVSAEASRADFFASFTKCVKHPEREVEFYCNTHDTVFCVVCALNDHDKACNTVDLAGYHTDTSKLREESEKLMAEMKVAIDHLNQLKTLKEKNKKSLKKKLKELREEVELVRDQVVKLMDNVVKHVSEVTKQIELENEDKLDEEISKVSKVKELTEEKVALLDTVRQHGSEKHQFISAHMMKMQWEEIDKKISEEDKRMRNIDAELKVADDIRKLVESVDVQKLVQITVNECKSSHKHRVSTSNYLRNSKLVKISAHTVNPSANPNNFSNYPIYNGIQIHKDGRLVLSDSHTGFLCLYNATYKNMVKIQLNKPYSATQIDDTRIAVSSSTKNTIQIVSVGHELGVEKTVNTQSMPGSVVALSNGQLAVAWKNPPAFGIVNISGGELEQTTYFEQDRNGRKIKSFEYVAVDEQRHHVIQPCIQDKAVYCFDFTGEPVFRYTNKELTTPHGVALDKCGNIYVCEYNEPGKIHKLSPAGELISVFSESEGVWRYPRAICCDNTGAGFWVSHTYYVSDSDRIQYLRLEPSTET